MPIYLGFDSSTQSLSAVALEVERDRFEVLWQHSFQFDTECPAYGTAHGVLPSADPRVAVSSPVLWAEALERMVAVLAASGIDRSRIAAVSGSAQQHGSVYLNGAAASRLSKLDPSRPLAGQLEGAFSRRVAPIWMDASTATQCAAIEEAVGGAGALGRLTGSRAFDRFTGPQIRKFFEEAPEAYEKTDRIHLVSSFLASLLIGRHAPLDHGDASGMNLMDLRTRRWAEAAAAATAPEVQAKLPALVPSATSIGRLSPYWTKRFGLPPAAVVAWSGDNPCSLIGVGLVREGHVAVSLGTSDTVFGYMEAPRIDDSGTGHVFVAPTGDYMGLTCFRNGSLARERIRDRYGLDWHGFSRALRETPPGNDGRIVLPWFEPEIAPPVARAGLRRYGVRDDEGGASVRGVVEGQMLAMARHCRWMGVRIDTIHATGGAAANPELLQVMADVFDAEVWRLRVGNSACLGAALRAWHGDRLAAGRPVSWSDVVSAFVERLPDQRFRPDPRHAAMYRRMRDAHAACEAHALGRGPDPTPWLHALAGRRLT